MTTPQERIDERLPGLDLAALEEFLRARDVRVSGGLTASPITGGRSNLTFWVTDGHSDWVVRRPPTVGLTPSAHDVGREYRVIDGLQRTAVPVAPTVASCEDESVLGAPFTVVGYIAGQVVRTRDDLDRLTDTEVGRLHRELIRVLAELHAVPYAEVGLADFGRPDGYVERQIRRWRQQWDHVATRELRDLERLHERLAGRTPPVGDHGIVHGDYRVDNTLLDPQDLHIRALVDWELATLGDPLTDVAMMCAYQHPDFDHVVGEPAASTSTRWPRDQGIADDYSAASGRDLSDFPFYLGLAYLKLAVIAEGIYSRYLAGAGTGEGYRTAGEAVPGLVAAGLSVTEEVR